MRQTFLDSPDDMEWLASVHGVSVGGGVCALLLGNEDDPDRVHVYTANNVRRRPHQFQRNRHGQLVRVDIGD